MTKVLRMRTDRGQATMGQFEDVSLLRGLKLGTPTPLGESFPKGFTIRITTPQKPNDFFELGMLGIYSGRLTDVLSEFDVNVESFKLNIVYRRKEFTEQEFFYLHYLDHVDCLDWEKSRYCLDKSGYADPLDEMVIDEKKAAGHHLFQLARVWGMHYLCSDELEARVKESGVSGIEFVAPQHFRT